MIFTIFICIMIMAGIVLAGKILAMILPDIVRIIIAIGLGIAGPIYFFINWNWILALIITLPWLIVCFLFANGSDVPS